MNQYSPQFKLVSGDFSRWFYNLKVFFAPVALMYLAPILLVVSANPTLINVSMFYPSAEIRGALTLYIINALIDILKKFISENGYKG
jgi:hypothetical protein